MGWFLLGLLLGSTSKRDRAPIEHPAYTMADRAALRAERAKDAEPPGLVGWAILLLVLLGGCLAAPSCMGYGWGGPPTLTLRNPIRDGGPR